MTRTMAVTFRTKLGPCVIQLPLGAGGMAEVYRAQDTRPDHTVAINVPEGGEPAKLRLPCLRGQLLSALGSQGPDLQHTALADEDDARLAAAVLRKDRKATAEFVARF